MDKKTGMSLTPVSSFFFFCFSICSFFINAQVPYDKYFELKEGIYIEYSQFIRNKPVPETKIVSSYEKKTLNFFEQVTSQKVIHYIDSLGIEKEIETAKIWGYCSNKAVHINYEGSFNRVGVIGSLCHFVASITRYVYSPDPFFGTRSAGAGSTIPVKEMKQFVFDTTTRQTVDFNVNVMEDILKRDEALYREFMALRRKKKRDSIFIYLRKYNEKHPLYFAAS
jgi:hypothetical protein